MLISKRLNREKFLWKTVLLSNKQVEKWSSFCNFYIYYRTREHLYIIL